MKRVIHWAAENGFDRVAWTTGDMEAERFDWSTQIESVKADEYDIAGDWQWRLTITEHNGKEHKAEYLDTEELERHAGKDLAEKIIKDGDGEYRGLDLNVGGEGMRGFYDKILPSQVGKCIKKWGGEGCASRNIHGGVKGRCSGKGISPGAERMMVNAYDKDGRLPPVKRWEQDGLLRYLGQKESLSVGTTTGLQLPRVVHQPKGSSRNIYTDRDLIKYRASNSGGDGGFASRDVTDTPAFKRWIGDSKVVGEAGEPLVVYHATPASFETFQPGGYDAEISDAAIWTTPNRDEQPAAQNIRRVPVKQNHVYGNQSGNSLQAPTSCRFTCGSTILG